MSSFFRFIFTEMDEKEKDMNIIEYWKYARFLNHDNPDIFFILSVNFLYPIVAKASLPVKHTLIEKYKQSSYSLPTNWKQ